METVRVDQEVCVYRRGLVWHIAVNRHGERDRYSLNTRDRTKAVVIARQLAADIAGGRWNIRLAGASVRSTIARYLWTESRRHHVPHTRMLVRGVLVGEWLPFLKSRSVVEIGGIRRETVEDFLASRPKSLSPATRNRSLSWVRAFLQWAHVHDHTRVNAAEGVRMLRITTRVKYTPTGDEIGRIAAGCYSPATRDLAGC